MLLVSSQIFGHITDRRRCSLLFLCLSYICENCDPAEPLHDSEPDADVLDALRDGAAVVDEQLLGVEAQLEHVVEQREERRQREGRHEDRDEAVLDDCGRKEGQSAVVHIYLDEVA